MLALFAGYSLGGGTGPRPATAPRGPSKPGSTPAEPVKLAPADLRLRVNEDLEYEILWSGVPAGITHMTVRGREHFPEKTGPEVWVVRQDTRPSRVVATFYTVRDKAISYIDVKSGFSRYFYQGRHEGNVEFEERMTADYTLGNMTAQYSSAVVRMANYKDPSGKEYWRTQSLALNDHILDPLSALYYLRSTDLDVGKSVVLPVCTERRVWYTRVKAAEEKESVTIPCLGGNISCLKVVPEMEYMGLFERKGEMTLWLDSKTKILVKAKVLLPIGECEIRLTGHEESPFDD